MKYCDVLHFEKASLKSTTSYGNHHSEGDVNIQTADLLPGDLDVDRPTVIELELESYC